MFRIILHGGAGETKKDDETTKRVRYALEILCEMGARALENKKSAQEVVELILFAMESNYLFNAGRVGGYPSELGNYNLDASMMKSDLSYACVAGVDIPHPISLVANLMKGMKHPFRTFYSIDEKGNPVCSPRLSNQRKKGAQVEKRTSNLLHFGTVGCIVYKDGQICVGSSTAGLNTTNKPPNRFADIGMLGNGVFCNSDVGVTTSGIGEDIMPYVPAFHAFSLMKYGGLSMQAALDKIVNEIVPKGTIGLIAINQKGEMGFAHNTQSFFVHSLSSENYKSGKVGHIKYDIPEFLFNPKAQCPIQRILSGAEPAGFCPFERLDQHFPEVVVCKNKKKEKSKEIIVSPVGGNICCINSEEALITIFISATIKHEIFAPISGKILKLEACNGKISRPELLWFSADHEKNARLAINIQNDTVGIVQLWLEVGKSWITDEIFLRVKEGDLVQQGEKIGELKIGSLGEVHFHPKLKNNIKYLVKYSEPVIGGKTPLVMVDCS